MEGWNWVKCGVFGSSPSASDTTASATLLAFGWGGDCSSVCRWCVYKHTHVLGVVWSTISQLGISLCSSHGQPLH